MAARFSYEVDAGLGQFAGPGQKPVAHVAHVAHVACVALQGRL